MQNSALGAYLALAHFPDPLTAVPCAISACTHSLMGSAVAGAWRWSDLRQGAQASHSCRLVPSPVFESPSMRSLRRRRHLALVRPPAGCVLLETSSQSFRILAPASACARTLTGSMQWSVALLFDFDMVSVWPRDLDWRRLCSWLSHCMARG